MSSFMKLFLCGLFVLMANAACPSGCSGHGTCEANGVCKCDSVTSTGWGSVLNAGYTGYDCSLRTCPVGASVQTIPVVYRGTLYPHPIDGKRMLAEDGPTPSPIVGFNNTYQVVSDLAGAMGPEGGILRCSRVDDGGSLGTANVLAFDEKSEAIIQYNFNISKAIPKPKNNETGELEDDYEEGDPNDPSYLISNIICSIFSTRNDLSQYKSVTLDSEKKANSWIGYDPVFSLMGWKIESDATGAGDDDTTTSEDTEQLKAACYNPKKGDNDGKSYVDLINLTVTVENNDVSFELEKQIDNQNTTCFILATGKGDVIDISESDLVKKLKKDNGGKWYYEVPKEGNPIVETTGPTVSVKVPPETVESIVEELKKQISNSTGGDITDISSIAQPKVSIPLPESPQAKEAIIAISMPGTPVTIDFGDGIGYPNMIIGVTKENKGSGGGGGRMLMDNERQLAIGDNLSFDTVGYVFANSFDLQNPGLISAFIINFEKVGGAHSPIECSGQGTCNRVSGECECYNGFTGEACQRMSCPNDCRNHGKCIQSTTGYTAYGEMNNMIFRCECDAGYRGPDCSLKECPSTVATANGPNDRDCSNHGLCDYSVGACTCFDGYYGEACQYSMGM